jgi:hypothetical protein
MVPCCPPGRGCNAPSGDEPCALALCRAISKQDADAALALERWEEFQETDQRGAQRRFRRRSFERARDRMLQAVAMRVKPAMLAKRLPMQNKRVRRVRRSTTLRRRGVASGSGERAAG